MSNKRYSITLKRSVEDNTWYATHNDPYIIELFDGADTIPTAFFATAPLDMVVEFMKENNLKYDIIFEGEVQ